MSKGTHALTRDSIFHILLCGIPLGLFFVFIVGSDFWQAAPLTRPVIEPLAEGLNGGRVAPGTLVLWVVSLWGSLCWFQFRTLGRLNRGGRITKQYRSIWVAKSICLAVLFCLLLLNLHLHPIWLSKDMAVFVWGLLVGQGILTWQLWLLARNPGFPVQQTVIGTIIVVLALISQCQPDWSQLDQVFQYNGIVRWSGLCRNPNHFGLLMALGIVLAVGLAFSLVFRNSESQRKPGKIQDVKGRYQSIWLTGLVVAVLLLFIGLVKSFSRGSWMGTATGLVYLASVWKGKWRADALVVAGAGDDARHPDFHRWFSRFLVGFRSYGRRVLLISFALLVLGLWSFQYSEHFIIRRISSVANVNDFSWRNRVAAYVGALQMAADQSCIGTGWNRMELKYDQYFRNERVAESAAILLNCYFSVLVTLGLPAFICFAAYIGLSFGVSSPAQETDHDGLVGSRWSGEIGLNSVCRAGAIVLLTGFWFDRGLFVPGLAILFWILLEIGNCDFGAGLPMQSTLALAASKPAGELPQTRSGLTSLKRYWVSFLLVIALGMAICWAKAVDPLRRIEFCLTTVPTHQLHGIAVVPAIPARYPVVVCFHDSGSSLAYSGNILRQLTELGFAAVAIDWQQSDLEKFPEQLVALENYLNGAAWAQADEQAWIGFGAGVDAAFKSFPGVAAHKPRFIVSISGWVKGTAQEARAADNVYAGSAREFFERSHGACAVLLVDGENDQRFPGRECRQFAESLRSQKVPVTVCVVPGADHSLLEDHPLIVRLAAEACAARLSFADYAVCLRHPPSGEDAARFNQLMRRAGSNRRNLWHAIAPESNLERQMTFGALEKVADQALTHLSASEFRRLGQNPRWHFMRWGAALLIVMCLGFIVGRCQFSRTASFGRAAPHERRWHWAMLNAIVVASIACAILVTAAHLGSGWLKPNRFGRWITERLFLRNQWRTDWDFVLQTARPDESLKTLLEHVELANLQRRQFYYNLDPLIFQQFVLSPSIRPGAGESNWRRTLWSYFYPRVRKLHDPEKAAGIVADLLRERIVIGPFATTGIETVWIQKQASPQAFNRIYVAALRSVGISARLTDTGQVEIWSGEKWGEAPQPFLTNLT